MTAFFETLPSWAGTLPGWITSAGVLGLLGLLVRYQLGVKKLEIEAKQVSINAAATDNADEADIRDHYADEVRQLRTRLDDQSKRHGDDLEKVENRLRECRDREEELLDSVRALKDTVSGLIRIIAQASASQAISLSPAASAEITAAARRVQMLFIPTGGENGLSS